VPGVRDATYAMVRRHLPRPEELLRQLLGVAQLLRRVPQLQIPAEQLAAFKATRTGAVVGEALAKQFGWKIGDTIPLQATIFPRSGSNDWPLQLVGIFRSKDRATAANEERQLMMNWKYFDESNDYIKNQVSWYTVTLDNPATPRAWRRRSTRSRPTPTTRPRPRPNRRSSRLRQAVRRHRHDRHLDHGRGVLHPAAADRQHHGAGGARAHPELATLKTLGFKDGTVLGWCWPSRCC
jgi:putative ABC transport system permease protein